MRPLIRICIVFYTLAMAGVSYVAHWIVASFGSAGGIATIRRYQAAMATRSGFLYANPGFGGVTAVNISSNKRAPRASRRGEVKISGSTKF
jgi:hypothetical protein